MGEFIFKLVILFLMLMFTCLFQWIKYLNPEFFSKYGYRIFYGINLGKDEKPRPFDIKEYRASLKKNFKYFLGLELIIWLLWVAAGFFNITLF